MLKNIKNKKDISIEDLGINLFNEVKIKTLQTVISQLDPAECAIKIKEDRYTRVFNSSALRIFILNLPSRARDIALWIIYSMPQDKDYLYFDKTEILKELGISKNTYAEAIKDLIKDQVLAVTLIKDIYWVNPLFFFNGSRARRYPDKVITVG